MKIRTSIMLLAALTFCLVATSHAQEPSTPRLGPEPLPTSGQGDKARAHRGKTTSAGTDRTKKGEPSTVPPSKASGRRRSRQTLKSPGWVRWLPRVSLLGWAGLGFADDAQPTGFTDISDSGFSFQLLELEVTQSLGKYVRVGTDILLDEHALTVEEAWIQLRRLPGALEARFGLMMGRAGFENKRSRDQRIFVDQPLALGKFFGDLGHRVTGAELSVRLPVSWEFDLYGALMTATGRGARSWFFEEEVRVESPLDLTYQLGFENVWKTEKVELAFELNATFGPNNTGRNNGSDVWGVALAVATTPKDVRSDTWFRFETEWYLRRRQIPADLLQDLGGWATAAVYFGRSWALAGRYDVTQGTENDFIDPDDDSLRHRGTLVLRWSPLPYFALRATGFAGFGGPLVGGDSYGALLHFEAGYSTHGAGRIGGLR